MLSSISPTELPLHTDPQASILQSSVQDRLTAFTLWLQPTILQDVQRVSLQEPLLVYSNQLIFYS